MHIYTTLEERFHLMHLSCPRACCCIPVLSPSLYHVLDLSHVIPCKRLMCWSGVYLLCISNFEKPRYRWKKCLYASMIQCVPFQFCSEMSQVSNSSALSSFSSWSRHGMSFRLVKWRMWMFATCPVWRCGLCTTPHTCSFGGHLWWFAGDAPFAAIH